MCKDAVAPSACIGVLAPPGVLLASPFTDQSVSWQGAWQAVGGSGRQWGAVGRRRREWQQCRSKLGHKLPAACRRLGAGLDSVRLLLFSDRLTSPLTLTLLAAVESRAKPHSCPCFLSRFYVVFFSDLLHLFARTRAEDTTQHDPTTNPISIQHPSHPSTTTQPSPAQTRPCLASARDGGRLRQPNSFCETFGPASFPSHQSHGPARSRLIPLWHHKTLGTSWLPLGSLCQAVHPECRSSRHRESRPDSASPRRVQGAAGRTLRIECRQTRGKTARHLPDCLVVVVSSYGPEGVGRRERGEEN